MDVIIDFLIELTTPMKGVDYAIAPIVLAGLAQLPGMVKGISASKAAKSQAERDEERARADKEIAKRALADLRAGKLEFEPLKDKLSSRYTDAYEMAMSRAPEKASREAREQALASAISASGDPRSMAASMQAAARFAQGSRADALAGLSGRQAATSTLAGLEQGIADTNRQRRQAQLEKERLAAQQLFTASRAQERAAQDAGIEAKRQGNQALLGALTGTIGGALQMQGVNKLGDIFKSTPGALSTVGSQALQDATSGVQISPTQVANVTIPENVFGTEATTPLGANLADFSTTSDYSGGFGETFQNPYLNQAMGGKIGKTGGVFDHETNKKALIDEESGEKEAELTGNETMFVFNPKQTSTFEKLVKGDDAKGLMMFMKKLLKKPQFNK